MIAPLLIIALCGCDAIKGAAKQAGGYVGGNLAEYTVCPLGVIECGHVFQCEGTRADTPSGYVEVCIDDDDQPEQLDEIETLYGDCSPTPRHQGLCNWHCDGGKGCNAFSGCWGCP